MPTERRKILFIVKSSKLVDNKLEADLTAPEQEIETRLGTGADGLGYRVVVLDEDRASALDVRDKALVIISATVNAEKVGKKFLNVAVPVVVTGTALLIQMKMINPETPHDEARKQTKVNIKDPYHPLAGGMKDIRNICSEEITLPWVGSQQDPNNPGQKSPLDMVEIATLENDITKVVLFGYRSGSLMDGGIVAPCKRVHLPFDYNIADKSKLKGDNWDYWELFKNTINWAAGEVGVRQFDEVFREEWQEIHRRRGLQYGKSDEHNLTGFDGINAPENLVGLALSGGGIRSATFCLGLLQGLQDLKLLRVFDYLSTVSGGGYLGGWWSAWLSRDAATQKQTELTDDNQPAQQPVAAPLGVDGDVSAAAEAAKREAAEREAEKRQAVFPPAEQIEPERLGDYRFRKMADRLAEGSLSASRDPIHHLRLFANYLTPRKGAFSADTWRAISVISRNLVMTWLILLPLLAAFLLAGQFFFVLQPHASSQFINTYWTEYQTELDRRAAADEEAKRIPDEKERRVFLESKQNEHEKAVSQLHAGHMSLLGDRAIIILLALAPFAGWIAFMYIAYMRTSASKPFMLAVKDWLVSDKHAWSGLSTRHSRAHLVGGLAVWLLVFFVLALFVTPVPEKAVDWTWQVAGTLWGARYWLIPWGVVAVALWLYTFPWRSLPEADLKTKEEWRREVWRNRIIRIHSRLLIIMVLAGVALFFSGFGHEIFDYIWRDPTPKKAFLDYVGKIGGWLAFAGAIAGTIFTSLKAAPVGGHDQSEAKKSSPVSNFIFAITPLLLIVVLMITLSWLAHELLGYLNNSSDSTWPLTAVSFVGVVICLFFALFETQLRQRTRALVVILVATAVVTGGAYIYFRNWPGSLYTYRVWLLRMAAVGAWIVFFRLMLNGKRWPDGKGRFEVPLLKNFQANHRVKLTVFAGICLLLAGLTVLGVSSLELNQNSPPRFSRHGGLSIFAFAGLVLCVIYVLVEMVWGQTGNRRSVIAFATVYVMLVALLLIGFYNSDRAKLIYIGLGLLGLALTWVVALGWMSDPNTLSMHAFYRGRIVRAYLGASNPQREKQNSEITESVIGDDMLLSELQNCRHGGPYHLLNTTLNLVGGRDLATAQRSSAMFVLSKLYCGSFRGGFRRSTNYMDGRLSLGTAVAVSGAAVSPGMGAGKTTASLAMLMTLMNVRLGYWAPTPDGEEWASAQARLWPFYMMREFLSQTSDLSSYCYLTDGGHFDNLGIYSLVERGCRYIVVADAVADPEPCFSDLGNAIRRCRIDFDADIELDITPFIKQSKDDRFAKQHYVTGTITYSPEHASKLGWPLQGRRESDEAYRLRRTGIIAYIKPSLLKDEPDMRADVRQYEIENTGFPQQSTVDQWFDEAQFESYRQLGESCAKAAFGRIEKLKTGIIAGPPAPSKPPAEGSPPGDTQQRSQKALEHEEEIGLLSPRIVRALFEYLKETQPASLAPPDSGAKAQALRALKVAVALTELEP